MLIFINWTVWIYAVANNQIIDSKYYHIFNNAIRVMLPNSFKDGILRILCTANNHSLIKENHTVISSGFPLSIPSNSNSPYFTNIYHLVTDRFDDGNVENNFHKLPKSILKCMISGSFSEEMTLLKALRVMSK